MTRYYPILEKNLKRIRFDAIAGGIQKLTEEILTTLVSNAIGETGVTNVILGGGVFMNVKADSDLVKECISGNKQAFDLLVDRYKRQVFNVALRITNDYDDAAEITQTTFVKAFENLHTFDRTRKFFSWLYRIATNESINHLKSRKNLESLDENIASSEHTADKHFVDSEQDESIQQAIMQLNPEHRIVIVLCHFNNLSYKEISAILDIPTRTVKSRLFSARKNLRELLEQ